MYQPKNIVGSSQNANLSKSALFLKISQKREKLASNLTVVGGKPSDGIISIRKSMLIGFPTSSIVESIYNKSSAIVGSIVGSIIATSSVIQQSVGKVINIGMLNNSFSNPTQPVVELIGFPIVSPERTFPSNPSTVTPAPIIPPEFPSTEYIFNYFDINGLELINGEYKAILSQLIDLNISTSGSYSKYAVDSVIHITSKIDCGSDQIDRLSNKIDLSSSGLFDATDTPISNIEIVNSLLDLIFETPISKLLIDSSEYTPFGDYPVLNQRIVESNYHEEPYDVISSNQHLCDSFNFKEVDIVSSNQNIDNSFTSLLIESTISNQSVNSIINQLLTSNSIIPNQKLTNSFESISVNSSNNQQNISDSYYVFADSTISDHANENQKIVDSNNSLIYQYKSFTKTDLTDSNISLIYPYKSIVRINLSNSDNTPITDNELRSNQSLGTSVMSIDRSMLAKNNISLSYGDATGKDTSNIIEPANSNIELNDSFLKKNTLLAISRQFISNSNTSFITEPVLPNLKISDSHESIDENRTIQSNLKLSSSSVLLSDVGIVYNNNNILNSDLIVITDQSKHNVNILDSSISKVNELILSNISNIYSNIDFSYLCAQADIEINSSDLYVISEDIPYNLGIIKSDTNKFTFDLSSNVDIYGGGYIGSSFFIPSNIKITGSEYLAIPTNVDISFNIGLISSSSINRSNDIGSLNNHVNINNSEVIGQSSPYLNSNISIHRSSSYQQVVFPMDSINITLDSDLVTWDNDFYPDPI